MRGQWAILVGMTQPEVVETTLVLVDANGDPTEDRAKAVAGEVLETLADGSSRSTLFDVQPPTSP